MRLWLTRATAAAMMAAVVVLAATTATRADRILTAKRIGINGKITGLTSGGIVIETEGEKRIVPVQDVARVKADAYPDLERAEDAYAQGQAGKPQGYVEAERLYRQMTATTTAPQWLRVLVQWRMYRFYADSGRVPEALDAYLELLRGGPNLVTGLKLPAPREDAQDANKAMLNKVEDALRAAGKSYVGELQNFKASLQTLVGTPKDVMDTLELLLASPDERTRQGAMLKQIELLVAAGKFDDAAAKLDANGPALVQEHPDDIIFWRGRILKERGQNMEAALEFMRLPILYPKDRVLTAEALWCAGQAMEAVKVPKNEVQKVYEEAVTRYAGTPGAERAKRELVRLGK